MRKLLVLLLLSILSVAYSQTRPPSSTGSYWRVNKWTTPFGQTLPDSVRIQVQDSVKEYIIHHVGGVTSTQTMAYAYSQGWVSVFPKNTPWKKEISSDAENNWTLPFVLTTSTTIFYNGQPLRPTQWSGVGVTALTLNLDIRKYDYITILNN